MPLKQGGARHVRTRLIPDVNEMGEVEGCLAISADLTDDDRIWGEAVGGESHYLCLVETMNDGFEILDQSGCHSRAAATLK